jgi:DNA-binding response OmpR family regulator
VARVLVVDDDEAVCRSLKQTLTSNGFSVDATTSPQEAIELLRDNSYDIAIYDLVMPDIDGIELLRETKKINSALPVVMITAFATIESAVEAMKRGASDYIEKPFTKKDILTIVRRALEEAKFRKSILELSTSREVEEVISSLNSPLRRLILSYLEERGEKLSFTQLQRGVGERDATKFNFHLRKLKEAGLVEQDEDKRYTLTQKGRKALEVISSLAEV